MGRHKKNVIRLESELCTSKEAAQLNIMWRNNIVTNLVSIINDINPSGSKLIKVIKALEEELYDRLDDLKDREKTTNTDLINQYTLLVKTISTTYDMMRKTIANNEVFMVGLSDDELAFKELIMSLSVENQQKLRKYVEKLAENEQNMAEMEIADGVLMQKDDLFS